MYSSNYKPVIWWLFSGCTLIFLMVVIGGITRLTGSGLSITEWKVIMGTLPPLNQEQWMEVYQKYQLSPEFQKVNYHMNLEEFKSIFWWEYIHRLLGRIIGIVFIIPFLYFVFKGYFREKRLVRKLSVLFLLGGFQGFLGWFMVKSGLQDNPHVSHYRLAAHLITAFFVYGFTYWFALDLMYPRSSPLPSTTPEKEKIKKWSAVLFFIVVFQIIYGAFVAGLKAGRIYNTFPKMGNGWVPEGFFNMSPWYANFFENMGTVQFVHRYVAYFVAGLCVFLWLKSRKVNFTFQQKMAFRIMLFVVSLQFLLGVLTLIYAVPVTLGVLHQIGALALFTSVIYLNHRLRKT